MEVARVTAVQMCLEAALRLCVEDYPDHDTAQECMFYISKAKQALSKLEELGERNYADNRNRL